jgi:O-antigen/teichoic acid export membrane protein
MTQNRAGVISGSVGFASRALVQLMLFGVTIVATRLLSIADFGVYSLATLFLILARALYYVGPYEYLLKAQDSPELLRSCFVANQILAVACVAVLGGVYLLSPFLFKSSEVGSLLLMLAPSVFIVAITSWYEAVLLRALRVRRYYLSTLLGDASGAVAAVALLMHGYGIASLVCQTYVRLTMLLLLYVRATSERPSLIARIAEVRAVLHWSKTRYAAVLLNFTSGYGADLVLGAVLTPAATGLYRASNRIVSTMVDLFGQPLQKIAQTNLSAAYKRKDNLGTSWLKMLSGVGAIAWTGLATLGFLARDLIPLVLGEKWAPAVPIVIAFCVIKSFSLLDAVTTSFLVCHDRQRDMLRIQMTGAVVVIVIAWLASPLGALGVAIAVGSASIGVSVIYWAMVLRQSRADKDAIFDLLGTSAPPVIAVVIALSLVKVLLPGLHGISAVVAGSAAACLAFSFTSYANRHRILAAIGSLGHHPVPQTGK